MATESRQPVKAASPTIPQSTTNNWRAWLAGIFLAALLGVGLLFPAIPILGAIASVLLGLGGLGGLGVVIGLMAAFLLPRTLFAVKGAPETAQTAKSIAITVVKAALFAGAMFAIGYFLMPLMMAWLAKATGVALFNTFAGGGLISTIMTGLSAAMTFFKTLSKGEFFPVLLANKARAAEIVLGFCLLIGGGLLLAGFAPFTVPLVVPIIAMFVGVMGMLGLATTLHERFPTQPAASKEIEMGDMAAARPGALSVPSTAPHLSPQAAAGATASVGNGQTPATGVSTHPAAVAASAAASNGSAPVGLTPPTLGSGS